MATSARRGGLLWGRVIVALDRETVAAALSAANIARIARRQQVCCAGCIAASRVECIVNVEGCTGE